MVIAMTDGNYRRLEDKIDKIFDQLSMIQQSVVELRTEKVQTCKELDTNRSEISQIKIVVDEIKEDMEKLNVKVAVISAGITLAVSLGLMALNWLLSSMR